MTGETSQTRNTKQLNDFLTEAAKPVAVKIKPDELISSVIPRNQDRLAAMVRHHPAQDSSTDENDTLELFDTGENELYTR